jgi:hypothetical protein
MDTTDIEKKSLEAHVELCAERYKLLENRMDSIIVCVDEIKTDIKQLHVLVQLMAEKRNTQLTNWGIGIISALGATVAWLLTNYVIK